METEKYDVFISYSRRDYVDESGNVISGNVVSHIKDVLSGAGITYWFDEDGIYSGENFVEKIVTNIEASRLFIYLSTANANQSRWTCKEIASADEFEKPIIPIRIDNSPYNKKVMFRISDLDYIDYFNNPERGDSDLVNSIKTHLQKFEAVKQKQAEESQRIAKEIKLQCATLAHDETKIEIERNRLLLLAEKVIDSKERDTLVKLINQGRNVNAKYKEECETLRQKNAELQTAANRHESDMKQLDTSYQSQLQVLTKKYDDLKKTAPAYTVPQKKSKTWLWIIFIGVAFFIGLFWGFVFAVLGADDNTEEIEQLQYQIQELEDENEELQTQVDYYEAYFDE